MKLNLESYQAIVLETFPCASPAHVEAMAIKYMLIDGDFGWSMALWTGAKYRDLRLAATAARRERIDTLAHVNTQ